MGDSIKVFTEVQVDNIQCSALIYHISQPIIEVYEVGQAWLTLGEAILTTPDGFSSLEMHLEMISRISCSILFPESTVTLISL